VLGITLEELLIALVRIAGSLPVLRWAFAGGIIAILVDLSDLFQMNLLDLGGVRNYQRFDKILDQVYLLTFLLTALRWPRVPKRVAIGLYAYRQIGFVIFEITEARAILLLFPNVFEFWFLFVAAQRHWWPRFDYRLRPVLIAVAVLLALKEFQEYAIHGARWLDSFTAVEAVQGIWNWLTGPFR
jgi:hypothetical protein